MPELPEVEVVRAGLAQAVTDSRVISLEVRDPRALKRHTPVGGSDRDGGHGVTLSVEEGQRRAADFERRMLGLQLQTPKRRGKFMWIPVARSEGADDRSAAADGDGGVDGDGDGRAVRPLALLAHLGMSGQMLLRETDAPDDRFVRIRIWIEHPKHGELRLDFADQRLFGSLALDALVASDPESDGNDTRPRDLIPAQALHIARDPLDPLFNDARFVVGLRARSIAVKSAVLDQRLISGVGNIYADEALWRARLHPETPARLISARKAVELLTALREVFAKALAEGGTSFDAQYVNVNGQAGYFAHSLNAYGRGGEPCPRCGTPIKRIPFAGRSSHFCPRCQRKQ